MSKLILIVSLFFCFNLNAQNNCSNAIVLDDLDNFCSADSVYLTYDINSGYGKPSCWNELNRETWFQFTAIQEYIHIRVYGINGGGTLQRPEMVIYSGVCDGALTELNCKTSSILAHTAEVFLNVNVGESYFIRVDGLSGAAFQKNFKLCINNFSTNFIAKQDCENATYLCDKEPFAIELVLGGGIDNNEAQGTCIEADTISATESSSSWLKWNCTVAGTLTFDITPTNANDDFDWVLFELPSDVFNCESKTKLRCNATAHLGATGINITDNDIDELLGFGGVSEDRRYNKVVNMIEGKAYALIVNNWSFTQNGNTLGYTIEFGGTGEFGIETSFDSIGNNLFCLSDEAVDLSPFGSPIDGQFSGNGVSENNFNPNVAGEGQHTLFYNYSNENECSSVDSITVNVEVCLSANPKKSLVDLNVFPNPLNSTSTITYNLRNSSHISIELFNNAGKKIFKMLDENQTSGNYKIKVPELNLPKGVYFIQVYIEGQKLSKKVVVIN